jgi:hypothetical protein
LGAKPPHTNNPVGTYPTAEKLLTKSEKNLYNIPTYPTESGSLNLFHSIPRKTWKSTWFGIYSGEWDN